MSVHSIQPGLGVVHVPGGRWVVGQKKADKPFPRTKDGKGLMQRPRKPRSKVAAAPDSQEDGANCRSFPRY